jgi:hypothetical protein
MKPKDINMQSLVDGFIDDCLTPSPGTWTLAKHLYEIFGVYCDELGVELPGTNITFGMAMSKRIQKRISNGLAQYAMVFKPEIFCALDHGGIDQGGSDESIRSKAGETIAGED